MAEDYDGLDVVDVNGERIGTVERSYVDDSGAVRFVEVKIGGLLAKHRLVPVDQAQRSDAALIVPFEKNVVQESPDASSSEDTLEGELLDEVRAYYRRPPEGASATRGAAEPAAIPADRGETPDTSKAGAGIGQKIAGTVDRARENLPGGAGEADRPTLGRVRDLGDVIEVPIVEEELVKRPVVKEVLRIRKDQIAERQTVSSDVRKEDVEVVRKGDANEE